MMEIRLGITGACGRGGHIFERIAELFPGVHVAAVCDVNEDGLEESRKRLRADSAFSDHNEMISSGTVDAVIVGTPMPYHVPQATTALGAGVHVLSEVPAGVSISQCRELVAACGASSAVYMMAENYIFTRANSTVAEIARAGRFGTPYYAEGEYLHELKGLNEVTKWRRTWQTGIDGITYGTHSLGPILQWFPDERVVEVMSAGSGHHYIDPRGATYQNSDSCVMLCRMSRGGLVKIRVDMLSDRPHAMTNYQLQGTDGSYESARAHGDTNRIWLRDAANAPGGQDSGSHGGSDGHDEELEWRTLENHEDRYLPESWRNEAEAAAPSGHGGGDYFVMKEFLAAVRERRSPLIGIHEAMDMTLPGLLSQQSIVESGRWLEVPDSRAW